uniref:SnoaL-like domain-containing protein n=1 Tax=Lotharella globosa TaxID=91324 RepID=A0A6U2YQF0_9EUKA|mmetsp:Transcript_17140/g.33423  ORF Transcript_17140/g.33423 Transcript_17140/m.33423 type:complete len:140 (-) Transcript_17140:133-552(-)
MGNIGCSDSRDASLEAKRKDIAMNFYSMAFNDCKPREAVEKYVGDKYIQHNPLVGDGLEPFIEYFEKMAKEYPGKKVEFKKALADGEYVILHCFQTWPGDEDYAGIDIFRFEGLKVVEHWDVLQVIDKKVVPKHNNGMF